MRGFRYRFPVSLLSVLLSLLAPFAHAQQGVTLGNSIVPPSAQPPARQVVLGNSTVPLDGLWKFHIGDNMAWAQPGFDDSAWGTMDLTPPAGSYDPTLGSSGFIPGWTARGYPGYSGYAWYRLRVNIDGNLRTLALKMPYLFDDAYQVYANGHLLGEFGQFTAHGVTAYGDEPRIFALPAADLSGPTTLAIRVWMSPATPVQGPDAGGLHGPPVLGRAASIVRLLQLDWDAIDRSLYGYILVALALLLAMLVAGCFSVLDAAEPAYRWLTVATAGLLLWLLVIFCAQYTTWMSSTLTTLLGGAVLGPISTGSWVLFWAYWFRMPRMGRIHASVWTVVALSGLSSAMVFGPLYGTVVPVGAVVWLLPLTDALTALLGVLVLAVAVYGIRQDQREGWIALPAALLMAFWQYWHFVGDFLHFRPYFFLFGVFINVGQVATLLSLSAVTVLLLRRFLRAQQEREQWRLEIEQAKQVQQMLIPEALPVVPGLTLESEYRPAQSVGGDFFQILPDKADGSVLIVVGDVTGHGLKAAMLVSLIVGAIREHTERGYEPLALLQSLNRRLLGRSNAQATCLALRIAADGAATLANAGHLPPYLNGNEMAMEGAMPLGMVSGAEFSVMHFQLAPGDRLMLLSDGVVEAQNEKRELFGFERARTLTTRPAATVADAAQKFGQQDDITVVSMTRTLRDAASAA